HADVEIISGLGGKRDPFAVGRPIRFARVGLGRGWDFLNLTASRRYLRQHTAFIDFRGETNPPAVRRPAWGRIFFAIRQLEQMRSVDVGDKYVGPAVFAQDHGDAVAVR